MSPHSDLHDLALIAMEATTPYENHAALLQAGYEDLARSYLEAVQVLNRCGTALFQRQLRMDEAGNDEDFASLLRTHPGYQAAMANKERAWAQVLEVKQQAFARMAGDIPPPKLNPQRDLQFTNKEEPSSKRDMKTSTSILIAVALLICAWLFRYEVVGAGAGDGSPLAYRLDRWTGDLLVAGPNGVRKLSTFEESK